MFAGPLSRVQSMDPKPWDDIQKGEQMLGRIRRRIRSGRRSLDHGRICLEEHLPTWQQKLL